MWGERDKKSYQLIQPFFDEFFRAFSRRYGRVNFLCLAALALKMALHPSLIDAQRQAAKQLRYPLLIHSISILSGCQLKL